MSDCGTGNSIGVGGNGVTATGSYAFDSGFSVAAGLSSTGDSSVGLLTDCLLYTSPSPRDLSTSRMPSSA